METITVYCKIFKTSPNSSVHSPEGDVFMVKIPDNEVIDFLKKEIKMLNPATLQNVDPPNLRITLFNSSDKLSIGTRCSELETSESEPLKVLFTPPIPPGE